MPNYLRWFARAVLAPVLALCVLLGCAAWAASRGAPQVLPCAGIALAVLVVARVLRGRNTRWDIPQPALWIVPPALDEPSSALWSELAAASFGLLLASLLWEKLRSRRARPAR
jgi:hypothetical protein